MIALETELTKHYYTIGEIADKFGVSTSLIRHWEREFSMLKPNKDNNGNRFFSQKDVQVFAMIFELVKIKGFTLEGAKQQLKNSGSIFDKQHIIQTLTKIKQDILVLVERLE